MTGVPFLLFCLVFPWYCGLFPPSVYAYTRHPDLVTVMKLLLLTDFIQFLVHAATHLKMLGPLIYSSHAVHHRIKHPQSSDAFVTGFIDAFVQLIVPLYLTVCLVQPDRTSLLCFGLIYEQWLLLLHSSNSHPILECVCARAHMVSPTYHHRHHLYPHTNFAHMFCAFDYLLLHFAL